MNCTNCGTENPKDAKFCLNCGTQLQQVCPQCSTNNPPNAKFCFNCGHKFGDQISQDGAKLSETIQSSSLESGQQLGLERLMPAEFASKLEAARRNRAMEGERRIVTILFCDIVGSTAAAEQLDPEEWTDIMNNAFEYLISPVYKYEGTLARLMGDAILAFFGAPIAHEDDPQRAIMAGLEILEKFEPFCEKIKKQYDVELDVRIGINTGLVVIGQVGSDLAVEYTAMGDAVNLAARMEQTAQPGTVQISQYTQKLIAPLFAFESLGSLKLKGKSEPIDVFKVLHPVTRPGQVRGIKGLDAPLVGRDGEMEILQGSISELQQGRGQIISLIGEAGLGKSRLIRELHNSISSRSNDERNILWLEGHSLSYETSTPYAPFIHLFSTYFNIKTDQSDSERYNAIRTKINEYLPDYADEYSAYLATFLGVHLSTESLDRVRYLEPPQLRERIFRALHALVDSMASRQPLVVVLDDLHWIDPSSLDLLETLLPMTEHHEVLIMVLFRPRESEPSWRFHELAGREYAQRYTSITLKPLGKNESRQLVAKLLHIDDLPQHVRKLILAKSEGNPFYVEEVIRSLIDGQLVVRENGHWVTTQAINDLSVPDTLKGVITARFDKLDEDTKQVVQAASVIGREFGSKMLTWVHGSDQVLNIAIPELQKRELILEISREPEQVNSFKHVLTQETVYSSLLRRKSQQFHLRAAEYLENTNSEQFNEIARHFLEGGQEFQAATYLVKAGDRAAQAYSTPEAVEYYSKALEILVTGGESDLTRRAYEGLGGAFILANDIESTVRNYQEMLEYANSQDDTPMQVSALNKLAQIEGQWLGQFDQAEDHLLEAERLAREYQDKAGLAELFTVRCGICNMIGDLGNAAKYLGESVEIGRELNLKEQMAYGLSHMAGTLTNLTQFDKAAEKAREALELSRQIGNRFREAEVLTFPIAYCHLRDGELDAALEASQNGVEIASSIGASVLVSIGEFMLGIIFHLRGEYQEAITSYKKSIDAGHQSGLPMFEAGPLCSLGSAYLDVSETYFDQVLEYHEQATTLMETPMGATAGGSAWADLGFCHLAKGDPDTANDYFKKGLTVPTPQGLLNRPRFLLGASSVALARNQLEEAQHSLSKARDFVNDRAMKFLYPSIEFQEALISVERDDMERALNHFQRTEKLAAEMQMRPLVWQSYAGQSRALSAMNQEKAAKEKHIAAQEMINQVGDLIEDQALREKFIQSATQKLE